MTQEYSPSAPPAAPGRPPEIEEPLNRALVHRLSRALVDRLVDTPITPNQVSVASFVAGGLGAAACVLRLSWPWAAFGVLACLILWHVLDGADGDLARRTGRASPLGELIDGVCDHASQVVLYVAVALALERSLGGWAWAAAWTAGGSHAIQSNAYETARKTYRHHAYGAAWMRQAAPKGGTGLGAALSAGYLAVSRLMGPGEDEAAAAMSAATARLGPDRARTLYRQRFAHLVKASGWLGATGRTVALFLALLAGSAVWYFLWEITVLNGVLVWMLWARGRANRELAESLAPGGSMPTSTRRA